MLKVPPISEHGNAARSPASSAAPDKLRDAVDELQELLYAA